MEQFEARLTAIDEKIREDFEQDLVNMQERILARLTKIALMQLAGAVVTVIPLIFFVGGIYQKIEFSIDALKVNQQSIIEMHNHQDKLEARQQAVETWAEGKGMPRPNN